MKKLGIIGGLGSEATVNMFHAIVSHTHVTCDQDHLEIIIHNNSHVPDRTAAILFNGSSPVPELQRSAIFLSNCGVDLIVIPCVTSHYFFAEFSKCIKVPILNAIFETCKFINNSFPGIKKIGILATSGTVQTGLFQDELSKSKILPVVPNPSDQQNLVMRSIYGPDGIKAGFTDGAPREKLIIAANNLIAMGAECLIAGCTEIPLVMKQGDFDVPLIDPVKILASEAIRFCGRKTKEDFFDFAGQNMICGHYR
ncbi:MAG: amino acid racemase [Syntrophotaleaceae bacterium]